MAQKVTGYIKLQIEAGKATPAPPVGPALGQKGVNIMAFTKEFNERTKNQMGYVIPVVITVYADRSFSFITKTPPAAVLIKKAAGINTASGKPNKEKVATLTAAQVEEIAKKNAAATGGSYKKVSTMEEAFDGADIVYPKSWAPFAAMEQRTKLYQAGDQAGIDALEKQLLAQNAQHKDWTCSEEMMKRTKNGKALYLHCLPADITGLSCPEGEVDNSVFDRYLVPLYKEASYKPYIIAAMILMSKVKDPVSALMALDQGSKRKLF